MTLLYDSWTKMREMVGKGNQRRRGAVNPLPPLVAASTVTRRRGPQPPAPPLSTTIPRALLKRTIDTRYTSSQSDCLTPIEST